MGDSSLGSSGPLTVERVFTVVNGFTGGSTTDFPWLLVNLGDNSQAKVLDIAGLNIAGLSVSVAVSMLAFKLPPFTVSTSRSCLTVSMVNVSSRFQTDINRPVENCQI